MAGARSLPPVSAKVIADAEQFIAEFRRAENHARRSASNIDREVTELANKVKKKFELGDLGKDLLKGAGLFGGMQIAETVASMVQSHFKAAAEAAQDMEQSTARSLEHVRKSIAMRQTDEQQLATLEKQRAETAKQLDALKTPRTASRVVGGTIRGEDFRRTVTETLPITAETQADIRKTTHELEELGEAIAAVQKKIASGKEAAATKDSADRVRVLNEQLRIQDKAFDDLVAAKKKDNDETARLREEATKLADKYREIADPALKFKKELDEINALMSDGKLKAEEGARAIDAVKRAMSSDEKSRVDKALDDFFGDMDARSKMFDNTKGLRDVAHELGMSFQSAFEDAIVSGSKLSDVLRGLAQDVARLFIRKSITEPLVAGAMKIFGFAEGGEPPVGMPSIVGEKGPELFVPRTAGTVIPAGRTASMLGGGGGDIHVHQHNTFATGVTRQEVSAMLPKMVEAAKNAVADAVNRGGGYRRVFA